MEGTSPFLKFSPKKTEEDKPSLQACSLIERAGREWKMCVLSQVSSKDRITWTSSAGGRAEPAQHLPFLLGVCGPEWERDLLTSHTSVSPRKEPHVGPGREPLDLPAYPTKDDPAWPQLPQHLWATVLHLTWTQLGIPNISF